MKFAVLIFTVLVLKPIVCIPPSWVTCSMIQEAIQELPGSWKCLEERQAPLGAGSAGVTYIVKNLANILAVAKVVNYNNPTDKKRADREVQVLATAGGKKNVVKYYGSKVQIYSSGIVMMMVQEYCENGTLESFYQKNKNKFSDQNYAMRIFRDIVIGVAQIHKGGFVHADLKPANIVVDANEVPKIIDFDLSNKMNKENDYKGSPRYMDYRFVVERNYFFDEKVDVYALGIILFEIATGSPPFKVDSLADLSARLKKGTFTIPQGLDKSIALIVIKCLQAKPQNRPNMAQLLGMVNDYFKKSENELLKEVQVDNKSVPDFENKDISSRKPKTPVNYSGDQGRRVLLLSYQPTPEEIQKGGRIWSKIFVIFWVSTAAGLALVIRMVMIWFDRLRRKTHTSKICLDFDVPIPVEQDLVSRLGRLRFNPTNVASQLA